ncbi:MAG: hypothetical protein GYB65_17405 [Chloroflexi bacterium]|nr:hypothetical protein [Chloroflexota bacterium]
MLRRSLLRLALAEGVVLLVVSGICWRSGSNLGEFGLTLQVAGIIVLGLGFLAGFGWQERGTCTEADQACVRTVTEAGIHDQGGKSTGFLGGSLGLLATGAVLCVVNLVAGGVLYAVGG